MVLVAWLAFGARLGYVYLKARHKLQAAQEALTRNDPEAAQEHLVYCLENWPDRADVRLLAASAARRAGRLDEAADHLDAYRQRHGTTDAFALEEQLLRAQRGDLADTEPYLLAQLRQESADAVLILEALTEGYVQARRLREAEQNAAQLLERAPDHPRALLARAWVMEQRGYFLPAVDDYRRVLAVRPNDEWARLSLGELLLHLNRPGEALEHFEALACRRPDNAAIRLGLARCYRGLGRTADARRLLEPLVAEHPDEALILSELGQVELQDGHPAEADRRLRQALALAPFDRQTNFALAQCARELGRPDEARQYLAAVERIEAEDLRMTRLRREIAELPCAPQQRCQVGLICLRLGRDDEAVRWLLSALREDPWLVDAHEALAVHYARHGRTQLAVRHQEMARQARTTKSQGAPP